MIFGMQYPGGKGKCYQHIINVLPKHSVYIETHLGGGAVLRHKLPASRSIGIDIDADVIRWWCTHQPDVATYIVGDALDVLSRYPFTGAEVVYCDPPYLPSTRRRSRVYRHDMTERHHVELLTLLKQIPCHVALSGYSSSLYRDALRGWTEIQFPVKAHDSVRLECLWTNYRIPDALHDSRFLGDTFHQRQNLKRRMARLQNRITHLSIQEQHALAAWLGKHLNC